MLEDIISNYRRLCTSTGQFDFVLNTWFILLVIFGIGGILGLEIFIKLDNIPEIIRLYISLFMIFAVEFIYLSSVQVYIFYNQKFYIKKGFASLIENESNEQIKNAAQAKLKNIEEDCFKLQYIGKNNQIETIYNKMKFDKFLKISKIDSNNVESVKENIKEYIKDRKNFKDIIDTAFWGLIFLSIFTPIIDYISSIYIPSSSTELNTNALMTYLVSVTLFIFTAFFINYMIHKINKFKSLNEKRLYISLLEKLSDYTFDKNDIERYIE